MSMLSDTDQYTDHATNVGRAIERVADKRHARMCQFMPEHEAAARVLMYLGHLEVKYKHWPRVMHWLRQLRVGYSA